LIPLDHSHAVERFPLTDQQKQFATFSLILTSELPKKLPKDLGRALPTTTTNDIPPTELKIYSLGHRFPHPAALNRFKKIPIHF
jgi:hypothetical protein